MYGILISYWYKLISYWYKLISYWYIFMSYWYIFMSYWYKLISVTSLVLSWDSRRAIINSTAFCISRTLSSLALLTLSTLRSYIHIQTCTHLDIHTQWHHSVSHAPSPPWRFWHSPRCAPTYTHIHTCTYTHIHAHIHTHRYHPVSHAPSPPWHSWHSPHPT